MKKNIRFSCTDVEHQRICKNAQKANVDASDYIKHRAMNPQIETIDFGFISEHTKQLKKIRESIDMITNTIAIQGNYTQLEIDTVVSLMETTLNGQKELLKQVEEKILNDPSR